MFGNKCQVILLPNIASINKICLAKNRWLGGISGVIVGCGILNQSITNFSFIEIACFSVC